ncbi:MAG: hypothetical protein UV78_C0032G0008 [Parcubacteria group bacterium GW2011_GWA2_43_17]|nr:MAG: hypothetical protein UV78_C0032G0008 [Parcubacteria group bacterium GW2011_GWA2_43_17]OHB42308.1 MAG: hypothetical protein A2Y13_05100 [Planctomycetes bacterium GWC2_45_44]
MDNNVEQLIDMVCEKISKYLVPKRIATAKRRMAGVLAEQPVDYLPMVVITKTVASVEQLPEFDWAQQWHDPAKSLYMQLKNNILPCIVGGGDFVPAVRADTGVINCMSLFGVKFDVPSHTKPVVTEYLSKDEILCANIPDEISSLGIMPHMIRHMEYHKAALQRRGLAEHILLGHCDLQGPFDIAAMVRGHDIFTDMYEDPDFVHHLMRLSTSAYIAVAKLCKKISGEPLNHGISDGIYMENGVGRICGDSDILVSKDMHQQFIAPYHAHVLDAFGGGWLHYCGGRKGFNRAEGLHLHESYAALPKLRGLNWTTGRDWVAEMRRLKGLGVVYIGWMPRDEGQSLEDYFRMVLSPYDTKGGFVFGWPELTAVEVDLAMDVWHTIQDKYL